MKNGTSPCWKMRGVGMVGLPEGEIENRKLRIEDESHPRGGWLDSEEMNKRTFSHLEQLEDESIHTFREVAAELRARGDEKMEMNLKNGARSDDRPLTPALSQGGRGGEFMNKRTLSHLEQLEDESIHTLREVAAERSLAGAREIENEKLNIENELREIAS